jgi:hypothetical protein
MPITFRDAPLSYQVLLDKLRGIVKQGDAEVVDCPCVLGGCLGFVNSLREITSTVLSFSS